MQIIKACPECHPADNNFNLFNGCQCGFYALGCMWAVIYIQAVLPSSYCSFTDPCFLGQSGNRHMGVVLNICPLGRGRCGIFVKTYFHDKTSYILFFRAENIQTRDHPRATGRIPDTINIEICPCQGFAHKALITMTAADNTMATLIFIVDTLGSGLVFFLLPGGGGVNILGTIRIHNIRRISTRISLMPVN